VIESGFDLAAATLLAVVGFAVGCVSSATGVGAGLALPVLAALGLPMPAALLAAKLPVALGDVCAAWGLRRGRAGGAALSRGAALAAAACGAGAASLVVSLAPDLVVPACVCLFLGALCARGPEVPRGAALWGAYVGACGIGAGALMRWQAGKASVGRESERVVRGLGAAANTGAVLVLLAGGQSLGPAVVWLALWQGAGAWALSWWMARSGRRMPGWGLRKSHAG
jgi:hypothetical protein